jgi:arabinogalactan oligomer/maltooligosaccharide transport system substrate-binding protein
MHRRIPWQQLGRVWQESSVRNGGVAALLLAAALLAGGCNPFAVAPAGGDPQIEVVAPAESGGVAAEAAGGAAESAAAVPQAPPATATPVPYSGKVVLWHSWAGKDGEALDAILRSLRERFPGVQVDTLFVAYPDLAQSYADAVRAGSGPDLMLGPNWWLGDLLSANAVLPLNQFLTGEVINSYWPAAVENFMRDGQLYGLPTNVESVALFINRALADPAAVPATTDELLARAQANPAEGIGIYNNLYHLFWGIPAYGGQLFDGDGVAVLEQQGDVAGYLRWLKEIKATPGSFVESDYGALKERFKKGEFAYFIDGPWVSADGVLINPAISAEQIPLALLVAGFLTGSESGATLGQVAGRLPANRSAAMTDNPLLQGFFAQAGAGVAMPNIAEMRPVWGYGGDMFIKVVDGGEQPDAVVVQTSALINEVNNK